MTRTNTKARIIDAAIKLFNQQGLTNVRNQDIATACRMSLSNFNYHFKTKKDLVHNVFKHMAQVLEDEVYGHQILIKEGRGLEITRKYFEFELAFQFFYLDTHNILKTYPDLKAQVQNQIEEAIQIIKNLNYMAIGMGYMRPEPEEYRGLYDRLAEHIWINNHFWLTQAAIRDSKDDVVRSGLESCILILYPHLTPIGHSVYRRYLEEL